MLISVVRHLLNPHCTISKASIEGVFECYFLEDTVREQLIDGKWTWKPEFKIKRETAIPSGKYQVIIDLSNRFQRDTPRLLRVPDFSMIRIHPGNTERDTDGCLLPGTIANHNSVYYSRRAYQQLFDKIKLVLDHGREVWIEIKFDPYALPPTH